MCGGNGPDLVLMVFHLPFVHIAFPPCSKSMVGGWLWSYVLFKRAWGSDVFGDWRRLTPLANSFERPSVDCGSDAFTPAGVLKDRRHGIRRETILIRG